MQISNANAHEAIPEILLKRMTLSTEVLINRIVSGFHISE